MREKRGREKREREKREEGEGGGMVVGMFYTYWISKFYLI